MVAKTKDELCRKLSECEHIALTSDGWTDDFRKVSYVTVTAHYFDSDLNLQSCILDTSAVEERKTAEVLANTVENVINSFGFDYSKVTIVTDNAANMIAAFRGRCCRVSCFAHCLNLVVTDMLAIDNADFQSMITNCKVLVRHFKHTGLQRKLPRTLKQECPTRWNSTYTMLDAVLAQYEEIHDVLNERKELKYLYAVDKDVLVSVVSLLVHFKNASEKACADSHPTLQFVVPVCHKLMTAACKDEDSDSDVVRDLKSTARQALKSKVRLHVLHDVAAFLNPTMKGLTFIPPTRKKAAMEYVTRMVASLPVTSQNAVAANSTEVNT